jgi:hypothetical protein
MEFGKVAQVPLRELWKNEAQDFTPWLEANPDQLGALLGMELEFEREKSVGLFSLDLLGKDKHSDQLVIVENQLEKSDHSHLGQLLTYAGGFEPTYVVWVAKEIRNEHKAALHWLNAVTHAETYFFGIEVRAIKIDGSNPAPFLDVVVSPNSWTKQARESKSAVNDTPKARQYLAFWERAIAELGQEFSELRNRKALPQAWLSTSTGLSGLSLCLVFTSRGLKGEFYFESKDEDVNAVRFEAALGSKALIERSIARELQWEPLLGQKASRIATYALADADVMKSSEWTSYIDWFRNVYRDFRLGTPILVDAVRAVGSS